MRHIYQALTTINEQEAEPDDQPTSGDGKNKVSLAFTFEFVYTYI